MARAFNHCLASHITPDLGKLAVDEQLLYLDPVGGVVYRARAETVAKAKHGVVLLHKPDHTLVLLVKGVLAVIV